MIIRLNSVVPMVHCNVATLAIVTFLFTTVGPTRHLLAQADVASSKVQKLLQDLDSDKRATRAVAEQELIDMGENVLTLLPESGHDVSVSVQESLQRVRQQVEFNIAQETLKGHLLTVPPQRSLQDLLSTLEKQSGNRILTGGIPRDLSQIPGNSTQEQGLFFELLDKNLETHELGWRWGRDGHAIEMTLDSEGLPEVSTAYMQGFRLKLLEVKSQRNYVDPESRAIFRLILALDVDPRMKPSWLSIVESDLSITSEQVTPELLNPLARREISPSGQRCLFPVDFSTPTRQIPESVDLSINVSLRVAVRQKSLIFREQDSNGIIKTAGPVHLSLDNWTAVDTGLDVVLKAEFMTMMPELESHRQGVLHREVSLKLQSGRILQPKQISLIESDGLEHRVRYQFHTREELTGAELSYLAPTLITTLPLTFKLIRIPLPME